MIWRCYAREFPRENSEKTNMAFLFSKKAALSAVLYQGQKLRSKATISVQGELGSRPRKRKMLDERMTEPMEDTGMCESCDPRYKLIQTPNPQHVLADRSEER